MAGAEYPKRESHFAHRFVRLMFRTCAAQDIGPEAVMLLTIIAHTEDTKRYTAPVTFWNGQLMHIMAFQHIGRLDRARKRAVRSGWLHYEAGGKAKAGKYWVTIPARFSKLPDGPLDCDVAGILSTSRQDNEQEGDSSYLPVDKETVEKRETNGRETADKRATFIPSPSPSPSPNTNTPAASPPESYSTDFENFWAAFPKGRKTKKGAAFKAWKAAIRKATPEALIAAAAEYALSPVGRGRYVQGPAPWLNGECWNDDREAWSKSDDDKPTRKLTTGPGQSYDPNNTTAGRM